MSDWFDNLGSEIEIQKPDSLACKGCNKICFLSCKIYDDWIHRKNEKIENVEVKKNGIIVGLV